MSESAPVYTQALSGAKSITRLRALKGSRKISNFTICLLENIKVELKKENYSLSPGLDIGEGNKLIVSLKEFVKNIRQQSDQKLKEYEEKAKKLSTSAGTDYSGINKRRITSKFSDKSTDKVSVNGAEKV
ncbi:hypothetical protein evm_001652 [Chilo suppressalis]|nr:hypothetical protein evm_001652 [Chilo suppressalis]